MLMLNLCVYFPKLFLCDKMEITIIAIIYEVFTLCQIQY